MLLLKKEKELCWKVFSLITYKYESNLRRLRDWLTVPKSNGYESLHITVRGPEDKMGGGTKSARLVWTK